MKDIVILVINPGSTSTKIALYNRERALFTETIKHSLKEISGFNRVTDQFQFRKEIILKTLEKHNIDITSINCIVGRGGLVKPIKSGVYQINQSMIDDLNANILGEHASNLGGLIANDISLSIPGTKAYIADPVVVDEMQDIARFSGHPAIERHSIFHALNQKAIARLYANEKSAQYENLNLVVVHMGGGISVAAHKHGRVIDVNDGLNGDGPFSPERAGGLGALSLADLCFSGKYTKKAIKDMVIGHGGMVAYLGTNSIKDIDDAIENGDLQAEKVLNAMSYQICKEIGSMSTVLKGKVDAILLTGGVAHCKRVTDFIIDHTSFIAPISIYPGEDEMKALALNGLRVTTGDIEASEY